MANYIPPCASGYSNDKKSKKQQLVQGGLYFLRQIIFHHVPWGTPTIKNILASKMQQQAQGD
jgi:hypothetical protein